VVEDFPVNETEVSALVQAAAERQLAVTALEEKYAESSDLPTKQLVADMRELLATERVVLDSIITLLIKLSGEATEAASTSDNLP
jgi:hypothetical protein